MNKLEKFNIIGFTLVIMLFFSSLWWEFGIFAGVFIGCIFAMVNYMIEDTNRNRRLKELEYRLLRGDKKKNE